MLELIPIQYYAFIFYNFILVIIIATLMHTKSYTGFTSETFIFNKIFGFLLFWIVVIYMGFRPISWYFGDMGNYAKQFDYFSNGWNIEITKDFLFYSIMNFFVVLESKTLFFFTIAFLYLGSIYIASKRFFGNYHYFAFLIIISSFEFWSYGTNGIRNGLATSIIILAFTFMDKKWMMYLLFILAFSMHSSVLIPIMAYFITYYYNSTKFYYKLWLVSIVISLLVGSTIQNYIANTGLLREDIVMGYLNNANAIDYGYTKTGFRWDFLLYSFLPIIVSYYFRFIRGFTDVIYARLTNIYLVCNSVWIIVIEATFSNRFAYLSWFMMGLIIIYPLLKNVFFNNQFRIIGFVILGYFFFTYLMNFILPNI